VSVDFGVSEYPVKEVGFARSPFLDSSSARCEQCAIHGFCSRNFLIGKESCFWHEHELCTAELTFELRMQDSLCGGTFPPVSSVL
jgi:hypothetical protein